MLNKVALGSLIDFKMEKTEKIVVNGSIKYASQNAAKYILVKYVILLLFKQIHSDLCLI